MKLLPLLNFSRSVIVLGLMSLLFHSCFLFPVGPDMPSSFTPTLEWIKATRGVAMDVSEGGNIVCAGDTTVDYLRYTVVSNYSPEGTRLYYIVNNATQGLVREVLDNYQDREGYIFIVDTWESLSTGIASFIYSIDGSKRTTPYTRFNTIWGKPDTEPYPWSGYTYVVGPSISKGPKRIKNIRSTIYTYYSVWMVGTFTDQFNYVETITPGKADCFVRRYENNSTSVRLEWGGPENDLAYDVASDNIGNATIFLRAGSDFGITSATQSLVRMKTGYNVVRLDTNGLLTETFPVALQATGELTDTQIWLGKNGAVYILAKDEAKKQYFLAKVFSSGTAWIRYFPPSVTDKEKSIPLNRDARMG